MHICTQKACKSQYENKQSSPYGIALENTNVAVANHKLWFENILLSSKLVKKVSSVGEENELANAIILEVFWTMYIWVAWNAVICRVQSLKKAEQHKAPEVPVNYKHNFKDGWDNMEE